MNEQITKENDNRFTSISDNMDIGIKSKEALLKQHEDNSSKLNAEIKRLTGSLTKVMKNNKDSDPIWYSIIGYFNENNPPIKIGDRTATIFELQSEIKQHIDSGGNLKSLDSNISVNGSTSSCGGKSSADYVINISL